MNVLVLGGGGREHALSWKIAQSPLLGKLYVAPGNAGTHQIAVNSDIDIADFEAIGAFVQDHDITMMVVGPEAPLVEGIKDYFKADEKLQDIAVIGPSKEAARLEGSKDYAKAFMKRHQIPTAASLTVTRETIEDGYAFIDKQNPPFVLKADGLAAGKGVIILHDENEAGQVLAEMLEGRFGEASKKVVLEEYLKGTELSVFVLTDGHTCHFLPEAKDYKRIGEQDTGPNTGGMGSVSPVPFADKAFMEKVENRIVAPTIQGIQKEKLDYQGFLFFGLMNVNGDPYVVEYNCRMGDPEAEVVIPRINSDLLQLFSAIPEGKLAHQKVEVNPQHAAAIIMASGGYPGKYEKHMRIKGLNTVEHAHVFHAGTKIVKRSIETNGGRVIAVTALADRLPQALDVAYKDVRKIMFDKAYYRHDIGFDL